MDMTPQTWPEWYDGRHINEVLFCQQFLDKHPMKCVRGRLFTVDGLIEDEGQIGNLILEEISGVLTSGLSKIVTNLLASIKLQAYSPPLSIETDRIHVANGTYFMDGSFTADKNYCNNRLTVAYNPDAPIPQKWLQFLSELLQPEDIPTLQEFLGYCLLPTTKGQKMLMLIGKGGEGKSRIGLVMRSLLGDSMNTTSIQKVESNRFSRADLENKLLMVDDDMDMSALPKTNTRKQGLGWRQVFLPATAPAEWQDRETLWNAVEETETAKDSRLAREFVAALPIELSREEQIQLLQDFIKEQFVADGMCADAAIHDPYPPGHNPHAHILLTVRPLDEKGKWQYKTEKEYLCVKDGEERGFTAAEFKQAQADGWEKQYQYKVGKKKVYMTPSAAQAQGYERISKYPKSTKYGRQNPITERWNSDEQLVLWRQAWADVTNLHLERTGHEERIDHRSHAERGLLERPTVHEGVVARAMEKKGIISDRCELNRQIKADNALLRELRGQVKKLAQAVKNTIPALADAMENLRKNLLLFCYQLGYLRKGKERLNTSLNTLRPALAQYNQVAKDIRDKTKERRSLLSEKKALSAVHVFRHRELAAKIAALTEDLEELRSEKNLLLASLAYTEEDAAEQFPKDIAAMEQSLKRLEEREQKYSAELDAALNEYAGLREQAQGFDPVQLYEARQAIRPGKEQEAESRAQQVYGEKYSPLLMFDSKKAVSRMLHEDMERQAVRRMMRRAQEGQQIPQKKKDKGQER